jgi:hypothetical protein
MLAAGGSLPTISSCALAQFRHSNRAKPATLKPQTVTSVREPPAAAQRHIMEQTDAYDGDADA